MLLGGEDALGDMGGGIVVEILGVRREGCGDR